MLPVHVKANMFAIINPVTIFPYIAPVQTYTNLWVDVEVVVFLKYFTL